MLDRAVRGDERLWRVRWAAIGAAVAVALGGGGVFIADAVSGPPSSVITIDPIRVLDTRDPMNLGLAGPFVSPVSQKLQIDGVAVPIGATGVLLNVTVVLPTAAGFVSVRPGDASGAPSTSSLNFAAGAVVPNAVTVGLPTSGPNKGQIDITYDAFGVAGPTTDVLVDVVGYFVAGSGGAGGGGSVGPRGPAAWELLPSGVTVIGEEVYDGHAGSLIDTDSIIVDFPAIAPVALDEAHVNLSALLNPVGDADPTCTGSPSAPTAPPGKVCVYLVAYGGTSLSTVNGTVGYLPTHGFQVVWRPSGSDDTDEYVYFTWAYTAP